MSTWFVTIPVKTTNPLNGSWGHWRGPAAKRKKQRAAAAAACEAAWDENPYFVKYPVEIHLVRVAPSNGLDDDSLPASMKAIRDGITDWLGLRDDRTPDIRWTYGQRRGPQKHYAVEVTFKPLEAK